MNPGLMTILEEPGASEMLLTTWVRIADDCEKIQTIHFINQYKTIMCSRLIHSVAQTPLLTIRNVAMQLQLQSTL